MGKRKSFGGEGGHAGKKQKTAHTHEPPTSEEVHTSRQLSQLLSFDQDLRKARHGLQSFKLVLDSIVNGEDPGSARLQITLDFLEAAKPREREDEVPVYLPDIMETWSMASQLGNENVMSAVPVVLSLLLKIISARVDLVPYGLGICRTLLQKRQQELLAKNLSAEKGKDFIISPTLRLLREATCMDGGALAATIFRARNYTFKALARNMGLRYIGGAVEDPKKPSVRTNAIRFFLDSLRLLHLEAKKDLLSQKDIVAALMRHLREDPPSLIYDILDTLKVAVFRDKKLPKDIKIRILNSHSLTRIASLYGYVQEGGGAEDGDERGRVSIEDAAHELLLSACTDADAGLCRADNGYYPDGADPDEVQLDGSSGHQADFGIDSIPWINAFHDEIPVRNMLLAEFAQSLRPWSSTKQSDLLVAKFSSTPELVAPYFLSKKTFTFDPKLSATWMGYAALLYNVVQLPIPPYFGHRDGYAVAPPPTSVILDNIVPRPMTPKAITRCLSNKAKLVSFFVVRLLILALQKLERALEMHREARSESDSVWDESASRLVEGFYERFPDLQDVINCLRTLSSDDVLHREATSRLIMLYYDIIPQSALRAKFDVSPALLTAIQRVETSHENDANSTMALLELEHLCAIAKYAPNMRWFARAAEMRNSLFTTLLRIHIENRTSLSADTLTNVLSYVAEECFLVEKGTGSPGLRPLVAALRKTNHVDQEVWTFLDNCFERCAKTAKKYHEMIEESLERSEADGVACPLLMAIAEQIPFLVSKSPEKSVMKHLTQFLSDYLGCSLAAGISSEFLLDVKEMLVSGIGDKKLGSSISIPSNPHTAGEAHETLSSKASKPVLAEASPGQGKVDTGDEGNTIRVDAEELEIRLAVPVATSKESALTRWSTKTVEELVEEGYATSLIGLLCGEHPSIRQEALTNILKMASKVKESSYDESEQVWLLLMEIAESAKESIGEEALPSITVAFACRALDVLKNPMHPLYEKVNVFLTSGPTWSLDKVPLVKAIVEEGPSQDGAHYTEVSWLLGLLLEGLRTPRDVALFHRRRVFEQVLQLTANPVMGPNLRTQVLRLLHRAAGIEGGSDTLIARFGAVSWLRAQGAAAADPAERALYRAVVRRLWESCDRERIAAWSRGGVEEIAAA
ncbi:ribosome 60S biogenesis N-terminal-domain-containing protein [Xylariaceae sp. FL0804]|nr:ribosome 60S biogenesis N-terminal-domain-containing protein [Xylariaceae sp. FL0804]